jgi:hypothetical protein
MLSFFSLLIRLRVIIVFALNKSKVAILPNITHDFLSHSLSKVGINPEKQLYSRVLESLEGYLLLHDESVVSLLVVVEAHDVAGGDALVVHHEVPLQLRLVLLLLVLPDLSH